MSRTKRSHWLHEEDLRDGVVRSGIKTKDTRKRGMKLLDSEKLDIYIQHIGLDDSFYNYNTGCWERDD